VDDIGSAAVQYLAGLAPVTSLLGSFPASDPVAANAGLPWIFLNDLLVTMEGSSQAAIVCSPAGSMQVAPMLSTARYPRLSVAMYVDPLRDSSRNIIETSGATILRGQKLSAYLHSHLQRTDPDIQVWGDMVTISCQLLAGGEFLPVPDGDGLQRKEVFYGLEVTGWTDVTIP